MPEKKEEYQVTAGKHAVIDDYEFFNLPEDVVDDWRWGRMQHLGFFWLDRQLVEKQAALVAAQHELDDAIRHVVECKRRLESRESRVRSGIDESEIFGGVKTTKDERIQKRDDIVIADQDYQTRLQAYNEAVGIRDQAQIERDFADQEVKNVRMRLSWRMHVADFFVSMRPVPLDRVPDDDGNVPALQEKPKPEKAEVPMNQQTRDWVDAMANKDTRYSLVGKMALQVLPEGVDPEHPKVKEIRADVRKHFNAGPTL